MDAEARERKRDIRARGRRIENARSTLIDALRCIDEHRVNEAFVGAAMVLVFLGPVTSEAEVTRMVEDIVRRHA